ncbi:uncharacterized protein RCO7_10899 [Rhynchosporium graminicola]|uniref:Uncharacterized protein n=1 Tax=Rhynchosporium graminicola TaxID=2792576 RepID=A0A1E1LQK3_9HELO|nr:uncharacterized protein RCO7_10899 [Rhynchosporium commune]
MIYNYGRPRLSAVLHFCYLLLMIVGLNVAPATAQSHTFSSRLISTFAGNGQTTTQIIFWRTLEPGESATSLTTSFSSIDDGSTTRERDTATIPTSPSASLLASPELTLGGSTRTDVLTRTVSKSQERVLTSPPASLTGSSQISSSDIFTTTDSSYVTTTETSEEIQSISASSSPYSRTSQTGIYFETSVFASYRSSLDVTSTSTTQQSSTLSIKESLTLEAPPNTTEVQSTASLISSKPTSDSVSAQSSTSLSILGQSINDSETKSGSFVLAESSTDQSPGSSTDVLTTPTISGFLTKTSTFIPPGITSKDPVFPESTTVVDEPSTSAEPSPTLGPKDISTTTAPPGTTTIVSARTETWWNPVEPSSTMSDYSSQSSVYSSIMSSISSVSVSISMSMAQNSTDISSRMLPTSSESSAFQTLSESESRSATLPLETSSFSVSESGSGTSSLPYFTTSGVSTSEESSSATKSVPESESISQSELSSYTSSTLVSESSTITTSPVQSTFSFSSGSISLINSGSGFSTSYYRSSRQAESTSPASSSLPSLTTYITELTSKTISSFLSTSSGYSSSFASESLSSSLASESLSILASSSSKAESLSSLASSMASAGISSTVLSETSTLAASSGVGSSTVLESSSYSDVYSTSTILDPGSSTEHSSSHIGGTSTEVESTTIPESTTEVVYISTTVVINTPGLTTPTVIEASTNPGSSSSIELPPQSTTVEDPAITTTEKSTPVFSSTRVQISTPDPFETPQSAELRTFWEVIMPSSTVSEYSSSSSVYSSVMSSITASISARYSSESASSESESASLSYSSSISISASMSLSSSMSEVLSTLSALESSQSSYSSLLSSITAPLRSALPSSTASSISSLESASSSLERISSSISAQESSLVEASTTSDSESSSQVTTAYPVSTSVSELPSLLSTPSSSQSESSFRLQSLTASYSSSYPSSIVSSISSLEPVSSSLSSNSISLSASLSSSIEITSMLSSSVDRVSSSLSELSSSQSEYSSSLMSVTASYYSSLSSSIASILSSLESVSSSLSSESVSLSASLTSSYQSQVTTMPSNSISEVSSWLSELSSSQSEYYSQLSILTASYSYTSSFPSSIISSISSLESLSSSLSMESMSLSTSVSPQAESSSAISSSLATSSSIASLSSSRHSSSLASLTTTISSLPTSFSSIVSSLLSASSYASLEPSSLSEFTSAQSSLASISSEMSSSLETLSTSQSEYKSDSQSLTVSVSSTPSSVASTLSSLLSAGSSVEELSSSLLSSQSQRSTTAFATTDPGSSSDQVSSTISTLASSASSYSSALESFSSSFSSALPSGLLSSISSIESASSSLSEVTSSLSASASSASVRQEESSSSIIESMTESLQKSSTVISVTIVESYSTTIISVTQTLSLSSSSPASATATLSAPGSSSEPSNSSGQESTFTFRSSGFTTIPRSTSLVSSGESSSIESSSESVLMSTSELLIGTSSYASASSSSSFFRSGISSVYATTWITTTKQPLSTFESQPGTGSPSTGSASFGGTTTQISSGLESTNTGRNTILDESTSASGGQMGSTTMTSPSKTRITTAYISSTNAESEIPQVSISSNVQRFGPYNSQTSSSGQSTSVLPTSSEILTSSAIDDMSSTGLSSSGKENSWTTISMPSAGTDSSFITLTSMSVSSSLITSRLSITTSLPSYLSLASYPSASLEISTTYLQSPALEPPSSSQPSVPTTTDISINSPSSDNSLPPPSSRTFSVLESLVSSQTSSSETQTSTLLYSSSIQSTAKSLYVSQTLSSATSILALETSSSQVSSQSQSTSYSIQSTSTDAQPSSLDLISSMTSSQVSESSFASTLEQSTTEMFPITSTQSSSLYEISTFASTSALLSSSGPVTTTTSSDLATYTLSLTTQVFGSVTFAISGPPSRISSLSSEDPSTTQLPSIETSVMVSLSTIPSPSSKLPLPKTSDITSQTSSTGSFSDAGSPSDLYLTTSSKLPEATSESVTFDATDPSSGPSTTVLSYSQSPTVQSLSSSQYISGSQTKMESTSILHTDISTASLVSFGISSTTIPRPSLTSTQSEISGTPSAIAFFLTFNRNDNPLRKRAMEKVYLVLDVNGTVSITDQCSEAVIFTIGTDKRLRVGGVTAYATPSDIALGNSPFRFGPSDSANVEQDFTYPNSFLSWDNNSFPGDHHAVFGFPSSGQGIVVAAYDGTVPPGYTEEMFKAVTSDDPAFVCEGSSSISTDLPSTSMSPIISQLATTSASIRMPSITTSQSSAEDTTTSELPSAILTSRSVITILSPTSSDIVFFTQLSEMKSSTVLTESSSSSSLDRSPSTTQQETGFSDLTSSLIGMTSPFATSSTLSPDLSMSSESATLSEFSLSSFPTTLAVPTSTTVDSSSQTAVLTSVTTLPSITSISTDLPSTSTEESTSNSNINSNIETDVFTVELSEATSLPLTTTSGFSVPFTLLVETTSSLVTPSSSTNNSVTSSAGPTSSILATSAFSSSLDPSSSAHIKQIITSENVVSTSVASIISTTNEDTTSGQSFLSPSPGIEQSTSAEGGSSFATESLSSHLTTVSSEFEQTTTESAYPGASMTETGPASTSILVSRLPSSTQSTIITESTTGASLQSYSSGTPLPNSSTEFQITSTLSSLPGYFVETSSLVSNTDEITEVFTIDSSVVLETTTRPLKQTSSLLIETTSEMQVTLNSRDPSTAMIAQSISSTFGTISSSINSGVAVSEPTDILFTSITTRTILSDSVILPSGASSGSTMLISTTDSHSKSSSGQDISSSNIAEASTSVVMVIIPVEPVSVSHSKDSISFSSTGGFTGPYSSGSAFLTSGQLASSSSSQEVILPSPASSSISLILPTTTLSFTSSGAASSTISNRGATEITTSPFGVPATTQRPILPSTDLYETETYSDPGVITEVYTLESSEIEPPVESTSITLVQILSEFHSTLEVTIASTDHSSSTPDILATPGTSLGPGDIYSRSVIGSLTLDTVSPTSVLGFETTEIGEAFTSPSEPATTIMNSKSLPASVPFLSELGSTSSSILQPSPLPGSASNSYHVPSTVPPAEPTPSYLAPSKSAPVISTSKIITTSSIITSCDPAIATCKIGEFITKIITLYTTVCPITTEAQPEPTIAPSPEWITSTVQTTVTYTVTACHPTRTGCSLGHVATNTIDIYTTICPAISAPTEPAKAIGVLVTIVIDITVVIHVNDGVTDTSYYTKILTRDSNKLYDQATADQPCYACQITSAGYACPSSDITVTRTLVRSSPSDAPPAVTPLVFQTCSTCSATTLTNSNIVAIPTLLVNGTETHNGSNYSAPGGPIMQVPSSAFGPKMQSIGSLFLFLGIIVALLL